MPDPIFIRPDHHYDSYTDYWRLVDLCGFDTGTLGDIDPASDNTYILTMQNLEAWEAAGLGWPETRARIVYWDLEWCDQSYKKTVPGLNEFWAPDRWYAHLHGYKFVPLGSHPDLVQCSLTARHNSSAVYDVALLAYMGPPRRQDVANEMQGRGMVVAPNAWGDERRDILEGASVMVHVHQFEEFPTVAAQRWALAASAGLPLLTEPCVDSAPFVDGLDYWSAERLDLPTAAQLLIKDSDSARKLAANMYRKACGEYRFDKNVREALGDRGIDGKHTMV